MHGFGIIHLEQPLETGCFRFQEAIFLGYVQFPPSWLGGQALAPALPTVPEMPERPSVENVPTELCVFSTKKRVDLGVR